MKTIYNLRETLFETLKKLEQGEIEIDKAKSINEIAQTIINTGKLEHDYLKLISDNNKNSDKKLPVNSWFINPEPVTETLKKIEEKKGEPYKFTNE